MVLDRISAEEKAKTESARADMKQHADKLIQGFEKLNESHARRAIWELVQNACDLSDNCEVVIDFRNDAFSFSHNGKPFTSENLISLIKQVSFKNTDSGKQSVSNEVKPQVGQFGTGFITTHSFGKRFKLNSILSEENFQIAINDFDIDRRAKDSNELLDKLDIQQKNVYSLIREGKIIESPNINTTFSFLPEHKEEKTNIANAESNLHHYIPIVLALNNALKVVKVIPKNGAEIVYKKGTSTEQNGILIIPINKNETPTNVYLLNSEDEFPKIVLPLSEMGKTIQINDNTAKLFLFFPLIGTEKWGCNFIIHSSKFAPTEPRDGIHINSKNEQTQEKEKLNKEVIENASNLIFDFVEKNASSIIAPINLAKINFESFLGTELENEYYKGVKNKWIGKFKTFNLVETINERKSPAVVFFLSTKLLLDDKYFDAVYEISSQFWNELIPKKEIAKNWTEVVNEWGDESIQFITVEKIIDKINGADLEKFNEKTLLSFYEYLIKINEAEVFENYKLLPNIKNEFEKKGQLKHPYNIDKKYIEIADKIIPEIPKQFIKGDFELGLEYGKYSRKKLSEDFNTKIYSYTKDLSPGKDKVLDVSFINGIISLCCVFPSENTQSTRKRLMPTICRFYELEYKEVIIPNIEDDKFDYDYTPFRALVKLFLIDIIKKSKSEENWVENNLSFLTECLNTISDLSDLKEFLETYPLFPNQSFVLTLQKELSKEVDFPSGSEDCDFLKETYKTIVEDIKSKLVLNEFSELLPNKNVKTGLEISSRLEQEFIKHPIEKINDHPNKKIIFQIIQRISDSKEWERLFPQVNSNKAIIMMAKISDSDIKNDLFSIIGLEDKDKISALGELSKNPSMNRIIELGKIALSEEKVNRTDFQFKHQIGTHIEKLVRERLKKELEEFKIIVDEKQGGQDVVVLLGDNIVFYLEVKSRWDNRNSITMSNPQIKKAVKFKEIYSLCCVEMSDYRPEDDSRYNVSDISLIKDRIRFLNDIGCKIEPLISQAVLAESKEEVIRLTDEYRATIPQPLINKEGIEIEKFVEHLINILQLHK